MSIRSGTSSRVPLPSSSSYSRRLRLIVREEERDDNLFVRLSPAVAFDLQSHARRTTRDDSSAANPRVTENVWTLLDEETNDPVSFLPLSISVGDDVIIYASYNGGSCGSSSEQGM